jgi:hypothetical protein
MERVSIPGDKFAAPVLEMGERPESVNFQLFCGVRRYVALAYRASYEDAADRLRGHIIPSFHQKL